MSIYNRPRTVYRCVDRPVHVCLLVCVPGAKDGGSVSQGQWVYISDTAVQMVPESRVLNSQAYLLFYEEIL